MEGLGRTKTDYEAIEEKSIDKRMRISFVFIENFLILEKIIHKYYTYNNERGHKKLPYTRVGIFFDTLLFF